MEEKETFMRAFKLYSSSQLRYTFIDGHLISLLQMSNRSDQYTKGVLGGVRCDADISTGMMTLYNIFSIKHPFYVTAIASFVPYSEMRER